MAEDFWAAWYKPSWGSWNRWPKKKVQAEIHAGRFQPAVQGQPTARTLYSVVQAQLGSVVVGQKKAIESPSGRPTPSKDLLWLLRGQPMQIRLVAH